MDILRGLTELYGDCLQDGDKFYVGSTLATREQLDKAIVKAGELDAEYKDNQYARDRAREYPSIEDQLDDLYHNGIEGWKKTIEVIKDKYTKEIITNG